MIETLCASGGQHDFNICDANEEDDDDDLCIQIETMHAGQDECYKLTAVWRAPSPPHLNLLSLKLYLEAILMYLYLRLVITCLIS